MSVSVPSELINTISSPAGKTADRRVCRTLTSIITLMVLSQSYAMRCSRSTRVCVVWSIISSSAHLWMRWECSYSDTFTIGYNYKAVLSCWGYLGCVSCSGTGEEEYGSLSTLEQCWVPALKSSSDVSGPVRLPLSPPADLPCTQEDITPPLRPNKPGYVCVI